MISLEPNFTSYSLSLKKNETNCAKASSSSNAMPMSGSEPNVPSANNLKAYYLPCSRKNIAFSGATATKINQAIKLGASKDTTIPQRYDGGYLVDRETNTIAYYGDAAKRLLKNSTNFPFETQVILQSDGKVVVEDLNGKKMHLNEPGAVVINPKTSAKVNVLAGNPLVIVSEKTPKYYSSLSPTNEHKEYFDIVTERNKYIYKGLINKDAISEEYDELLNKKIIYNCSDKDFKFANFKSESEVKSKLEETNLSVVQKLKVAKMYRQSRERMKNPNQTPGEVSKNDFKNCPDVVFHKLCMNGLLKVDPKNPNNATWSQYYKRDELQKELSIKLASMPSQHKEILKIWDKTTKSGYDLTGLISSSNGIYVYKHSEKMNQFNSKPTEWITNSSAWSGNKPLHIGVSRVVSDETTEARSIKEIRPEEGPHQHKNPKEKHKRLTEIYLLTQGSAAIGTIEKGKPKLKILHAGDMCVIPSDVAHGVVAIDGEYEHLCFQTPSAFQYGFSYKTNLSPFSNNFTDEAIDKLKDSRDEL